MAFSIERIWEKVACGYTLVASMMQIASFALATCIYQLELIMLFKTNNMYFKYGPLP